MRSLNCAISEGPRDITQKSLSFIERGVEPACYLYRHYHPNGDLLYAGVSLHALTRQHAHFKQAAWHAAIHLIVIEPFETREEALGAEQHTIKTELPKFNVTHNGRRHPWQEIAQIENAAPRPP
jgi:hypothetical protein